MSPHTDAQRAEWHRRAFAECACGHVRARHTNGAWPAEACDEDGCGCADFREAGGIDAG